MKVPDKYLDKPTWSYFVVTSGAFAMVYTLRGKILKMWFVPREDKEK